ncbi:MAG: hypothetical protein WBN88_18445 [Anderseniella sp.]
MAKDELINATEAARIYGFSPKYLDLAKSLRVAPRYVVIDGKVLYKPSVLEAYKTRRACSDAYDRDPNSTPDVSKYGQDDTGVWHPRHLLSEAHRLRLIRYFSGIPCKRGHLVERFAITNQCTWCAKHERVPPERKKKRFNFWTLSRR